MAAGLDTRTLRDRWPFGVKLIIALYTVLLVVGLALAVYWHQTSPGHGPAMILSFTLIGDFIVLSGIALILAIWTGLHFKQISWTRRAIGFVPLIASISTVLVLASR